MNGAFWAEQISLGIGAGALAAGNTGLAGAMLIVFAVLRCFSRGQQ